MKYKLEAFYLHGLRQDPIDRDFQITPSLVVAKASKEVTKDLGFAIGIGIKWGFIAIGFKFFGVHKIKNN